MELESKHLAGYFPHELDCVIKNKIVRLTSLNRFSCETRPSVHGFTWCSFKDIKPILRPISDLAKEIEVNGEASIYLVEIIKLKDNGDWIRVQKGDFMNLPYYLIEKLQEWHFDIYGLIPNGLAIDINTL